MTMAKVSQLSFKATCLWAEEVGEVTRVQRGKAVYVCPFVGQILLPVLEAVAPNSVRPLTHRTSLQV